MRLRGTLLTLFSLFVTQPLIAQTVLQKQGRYSPGTRVASPWSGVSFVIPADFVAGFDTDAETILLTSPARPGVAVGVYAYSETDLEEMADMVVAHLGKLGIQLTPLEPPVQDASTARGWYQALTPDGPGVLYGVVRTGAPGNAIAVVALSPAGQDSVIRPLVDDLLASTQFSRPSAADWRRQAGGQRFSTSGGSSDYSPGGAGAGGMASSRDAELELCSDGTYGYQYRSEMYISVEGAGSAERTEQDQHQGRWWLVADLLGTATLVLEATDGREFFWPVAEQQRAVLINETSFYAAPSARCP